MQNQGAEWQLRIRSYVLIIIFYPFSKLISPVFFFKFISILYYLLKNMIWFMFPTFDHYFKLTVIGYSHRQKWLKYFKNIFKIGIFFNQTWTKCLKDWVGMPMWHNKPLNHQWLNQMRYNYYHFSIFHYFQSITYKFRKYSFVTDTRLLFHQLKSYWLY